LTDDSESDNRTTESVIPDKKSRLCIFCIGDMHFVQYTFKATPTDS